MTEKPVFQNSDDNLIATNTKPVKESSIEEPANIKNVKLTIITGKIYNASTLEPIEATIEVFDNENNTIVSVSTSNSNTGKYLISLPSGKNYGLLIKADGYLFHSEHFDLPETQTFRKVNKDIKLEEIIEGSKVILKNIFFDFDKSVLRKESFPELNRVVKFMNENPQINIEISGHTDNKGTHEYNVKLSEKRAKAVTDYIIKQGIKTDRIKYRGASFDEPIASNKTPEGRQLNRRVEFKIINTN